MARPPGCWVPSWRPVCSADWSAYAWSADTGRQVKQADSGDAKDQPDAPLEQSRGDDRNGLTSAPHTCRNSTSSATRSVQRPGSLAYNRGSRPGARRMAGNHQVAGAAVDDTDSSLLRRWACAVMQPIGPGDCASATNARSPRITQEISRIRCVGNPPTCLSTRVLVSVFLQREAGKLGAHAVSVGGEARCK